MTMWQIWLIVAGIFFVMEMMTAGFLVFWIGIGAILAMVASLFTDNLIIQTAIFVVSSGILLLLSKPIVEKYLRPKNTIPTNVSSLIGKIGVVTKSIDPKLGTGQIKVSGEPWSVKSDEYIKEGKEVEVLQIDGVKLVVKEVTHGISNN